MSRGGGTLYGRLLSLHHLQLSQLSTFVLFEGSVLLAIALALAEITTWWGVLAIPVAVAVMVKFNDVVAGVLNRPQAIAQPARPGVTYQPAIGWSPAPVAARVTRELEDDDAVPDPEARPGIPELREGVVRGVAAVPVVVDAHNRRLRLPRPGQDPHPGGGDGRARGNQGRFAS